jgi:hypothetical protein
MNKQKWLADQIKKFPKLSARELTAKLNDKTLVDNPEPQQQIAVLPSLTEVLAAVTPKEAFNISETRTYNRILEAFNQGNTSNIIAYLGVLKGGDNVLSESSYDKLISMLQRTQPDPNYHSQVWMSPAELAGFDVVLVNEVEELMG